MVGTMAAMRLLVLAAAAVGAAALGGNGHGVFRGDNRKDERAERFAKHVQWMRDSLAAKGVVLSSTPLAGLEDGSAYSVSVQGVQGSNALRVVCTAPADKAAASDMAVISARYASMERDARPEPLLVACASQDSAYLSTGTAAVSMELADAPVHVFGLLLVQQSGATEEQGSSTYAVAARGRWGQHHGQQEAPRPAQPEQQKPGVLSWMAEQVSRVSIARPVAAPAAPMPVLTVVEEGRALSIAAPTPTATPVPSSTPTPSVTVGSSPSASPSQGYKTGVDPNGLSEDEKHAEEKVKEQEASAGLLITLVGVGFIVYLSNRHARLGERKDGEEAHH